MDSINLDSVKEALISYIPSVIGALLTLIIGFWVVNRIAKVARNSFMKSNLDVSLAKFLASLVSVGLKVLLLLAVAGMFGIETTSFIAVFSAVAFAIGMALQGNLGHLASGVMLMLFKPFKVGEVVNLSGHIGKVEEINAFNTVLRTFENKRVYLPNGTITSNPIINISGQGTLNVDMTFGIGYNDDIDKARSILKDVIASCPQIKKDEPTLIEVKALADSSVNFAVRAWCDAADYFAVWFYMHENVKKSFDKAGVGIPFPQMDVHMIQN